MNIRFMKHFTLGLSSFLISLVKSHEIWISFHFWKSILLVRQFIYWEQITNLESGMVVEQA